MKQIYHKRWPMHKFTGIIFFLIFSTSIALGQKAIGWKDLEDVSYAYEYEAGLNLWYGKPTFGASVKALEGQEVVIKGYVIPLELSGGNYILSAYPYQACFFCGGAGQETVMELQFKSNKTRYKLDQQGTFIGTLRLNDDELEVSYILEDAKLYKKGL